MDNPQRRRGHWELLDRAANFPLMDQFGPGHRAIVLIKKNRKFCRAHGLSESPKPRRISGELSLSTPIEYGKMARRGLSKRREFPMYVVLGNFPFFSGPLFSFPGFSPTLRPVDHAVGQYPSPYEVDYTTTPSTRAQYQNIMSWSRQSISIWRNWPESP